MFNILSSDLVWDLNLMIRCLLRMSVLKFLIPNYYLKVFTILMFLELKVEIQRIYFLYLVCFSWSYRVQNMMIYLNFWFNIGYFPMKRMLLMSSNTRSLVLELDITVHTRLLDWKLWCFQCVLRDTLQKERVFVSRCVSSLGPFPVFCFVGFLECEKGKFNFV